MKLGPYFLMTTSEEKKSQLMEEIEKLSSLKGKNFPIEHIPIASPLAFPQMNSINSNGSSEENFINDSPIFKTISFNNSNDIVVNSFTNDIILTNFPQQENKSCNSEQEGKKKVFLSFRKKRRRKNKHDNKNGNNGPFICEHIGCGLEYKTMKQMSSHHHKMDAECKSDTLRMLYLIRSSKDIILNSLKFNNEDLDHLREKYGEVMKNLRLKEHVLLVTGKNFDDLLI